MILSWLSNIKTQIFSRFTIHGIFLGLFLVLAEDAIKAALADYKIKQNDDVKADK